jgi:septal ring factor EnvC (AmiA/AmiB activator)
VRGALLEKFSPHPILLPQGEKGKQKNNLSRGIPVKAIKIIHHYCWFFLLLFIMTAFSVLAQEPPAPADTPVSTPSDLATVNQNLHQNKKSLAEIQKQIKEHNKIKSQTEAKEKNVLSRLQRVDQALGKLRREKEANQEELDETRDRLDRLQSNKAQNRLLLEQDRTLLKERLRALYRMSFRTPLLGGLLSSENPSDLARKLKFETLLAQSNEKLMDQTMENETALETASADWKLEEQRKERILTAQGRKEKEIGREKNNRAVVLASLKRQKESQEQWIAELNEAAGDLQQKVSMLLSQAQTISQEAAVVPPPVAGVGLKVVRGRIPWPVSGKIMLSFGKSRNKEFNEMVENTGIQIAAPQGTPFRAVAKGKVRYADWFKGYGKLVILDHGKGYYSLYAQAAEISVAEGTEVAQGQILGTVGDTGSLYADQWGTSLYFEIRQNGIPQDPVRWLKRQHE